MIKNNLISLYRKIISYKYLLVSLAITLVILLGKTILTTQSTVNVTPKLQETIFSKKLTHIEESLARLHAQTIQNKPQAINLNAISTEIGALKEAFASLTETSTTNLKASIETSEATLSQTIQTLNQAINSLKKEEHKKSYLDEKILPFTVFAIDNIQEQNIVSVRYYFKTVPLAKGDSLAGWKLVHVSFVKQIAEFTNLQKERIKITLSSQGENHG